MSSKDELTILFQYGGRPYIEEFARDILDESTGDGIEAVDLNCSDKTIGQGFNELVSSCKTKYMLWTPDDFGFFPNGDWVNMAIKILENRPDVGLIDLRKERDGESPWAIDGREWIGDMSLFIIHCWDDRVFNLTPFIARTEDIKKILPLDEQDKTGNVAEASGIDKFRNLGLKRARLDIPHMGVCFHLGWGRSRY